MTCPSLTPQEVAKAAESTEAPLPLDLGEVRERLSGLSGPRFWRGIEDLAGDERFRAFLGNRFPGHASDWDESLASGLSRRRFFELSMASLALGGLTACTRQPLEKIVPYVRQPEEIVPGVPLFFATAATVGGYAQGLLAESHEGRPTKVEGNPEHPGSLGAATGVAQATVLGLYDPDRSQMVTQLGTINTWTRFADELRGVARAQGQLGGEGLRILTPAVSSPTLAGQMEKFREVFPKAKWVTWEAAGRGNARAGAVLAFGRPLETRYDLARAEVVLAVESDFLASGPWSTRYAKDFAKRRRPAAGAASPGMLRLYAVESTPTPTGAAADHRLALRASAVAAFVQAVGFGLRLPGFSRPAALGEKAAAWAAVCARDLARARGRAAVVAGDWASPAVHAACAAINDALGAAGGAVVRTEPVLADTGDPAAALAGLAADMKARKVDALLVIGANPAYDAPADLAFAQAMLKVPFRAHVGLYADETSRYCPWHVPMAHELEAWGDARSLDGTATIVQPLVDPLYDGRSAVEILSVLLDESPRRGYDVVRARWQGTKPAAAFETEWRKWLHDGVVAGSAFPPVAVETDVQAAAAALAAEPATVGGRIELTFRPDPSILDGRFANSGWLQELPKPMSKLTWDNAAVLSPATAAALGASSEDRVVVSAGGRKATLPVLVQPGQADGVVTLHLGFGRTAAGRVGNGVGVDAGILRTSSALWLVASVEVTRAGGTASLSHTQRHFRMEGRELLRVGTLGEFLKDPTFAKKAGDLPPKEASLFPGFEYKEHAWGMSVDLSACIGCNACVVACQAENNIPVVGKEQVGRGREMHWIRIDQYYEGSVDEPRIHHQPVMCQHCENAPCEVVCPVAATVHSADGLNDMVYNRCVGTRYCSNNCPYKVRRFNFFEYNGDVSPAEKMGKNPDVTVRSRGVMEKCTFCVQRINRAKITAQREGRGVRDGEARTACQQTCPTEAITFGNLADPVSAATRLRADGRTYWLLDELNTRPRTSYMARVTNPNPEMEAAVARKGA